jgi:aerobic-type carbon monoxide dehydrogenase small subunit (CoxS/CutS family)
MRWSAEVDGRLVECDVPGNASLAEALRGGAENTAVKVACGEGICGACSCLVAGERVHGCIYPAFRAYGQVIQTAASFADGPVARALVEAGGVQCGFCTPGMVVAVHSLSTDVPATEAGIRHALAGNLCRCTGYAGLVAGAVAGLQRLRAGEP